MLSGASTLEQMTENTAAYARREPLSKAERAALDRAVVVMREMQVVACTNCRYCVKDCPQGVKIPEITSLLNLEAMTSDHEFVKGLYSWQAAEGRVDVHRLRDVREHVPPENRHRRSAEDGGGAFRVGRLRGGAGRRSGASRLEIGCNGGATPEPLAAEGVALVILECRSSRKRAVVRQTEPKPQLPFAIAAASLYSLRVSL